MFITIHTNTQLDTILKLRRKLQHDENGTTGHILNATGSEAPLEGAPDPAATGTYMYIYVFIGLHNY